MAFLESYNYSPSAVIFSEPSCTRLYNRRVKLQLYQKETIPLALKGVEKDGNFLVRMVVNWLPGGGNSIALVSSFSGK